MIWFTQKKELNEIEVRDYQNRGIIISIFCYDDENEQNGKNERRIIQDFIDQIMKNNECIITGCFCEKRLDKINQKNIIRKIEVIDEKLIKKNLKRQKKKLLDINRYYLKNFSINSGLFEIAFCNFVYVTIWNKKEFNEKKILDTHSKENDSAELCTLTLEHENTITLYISNELVEYRDNLFKELQNLGYKIKYI